MSSAREVSFIGLESNSCRLKAISDGRRDRDLAFDALGGHVAGNIWR